MKRLTSQLIHSDALDRRCEPESEVPHPDEPTPSMPSVQLCWKVADLQLWHNGRCTVPHALPFNSRMRGILEEFF